MALSYIQKAAYLIGTQIGFIERKILSQTDSEIISELYPKKIQWEGKQIELVELVYALHEAGSFGKTSLKTLFTFIGQVFDCEITNYYRLFWDIKIRTAEEYTFFLNKLRKVLSDKIVRMNSGARS